MGGNEPKVDDRYDVAPWPRARCCSLPIGCSGAWHLYLPRYSSPGARRGRKSAEDRNQRCRCRDCRPVTHPSGGAAAQQVRLPADTQAFTDTAIYSRTNGYLLKWYADIGTNVRKGQLLAVVQTPEVDQQVQQAQADVTTAKSQCSTGGNHQRAVEGTARQETQSAGRRQTRPRLICWSSSPLSMPPRQTFRRLQTIAVL